MLLNVVDPLNANKRALGAPQALGGDAGNGVALADLDQDQDLDVVVATSAGEPNQVFVNGGSGTFTGAALARLAYRQPRASQSPTSTATGCRISRSRMLGPNACT